MPELLFSVESIEAEGRSVSPQLAVRLRVINADPSAQVRSISLDAQVRIRAGIRKNLYWTQASCHVPPFNGSCTAKLLLHCSFDFNVAATRYFHRLPGGQVPLEFLFSGTVIYADADGTLRAEQVPWTKEAHYMLPVRVWQDMMNHHYPDTVWLRLPRAVFERLQRYRSDRGLPRWEQAVTELLDEQPAEAHR